MHLPGAMSAPPIADVVTSTARFNLRHRFKKSVRHDPGLSSRHRSQKERGNDRQESDLSRKASQPGPLPLWRIYTMRFHNALLLPGPVLGTIGTVTGRRLGDSAWDSSDNYGPLIVVPGVQHLDNGFGRKTSNA